jgi:replicative DNA helicase
MGKKFLNSWTDPFFLILLLNLAIRGAMSGVPIDPFSGNMPTIDSEPERLFLYVTLENYVYETWMRLYSCLTRKTKSEMLPGFRNGSISPKEIQREIGKILEPYNCSIQVEYFPSNTISPVNIAALMRKYGRNPSIRAVKAVYLDYLDLLQPDEKNEFYRLDLGAITSRLKTIAASFEIPIITATQLNREAYRREKDKGLGMETISESIQKVFIADFGAIIQRIENPMDQTNGDQPPQPIKAILKVEKNRDGRVGKMDLYFDYPRSRILTSEEYREEFGRILQI